MTNWLFRNLSLSFHNTFACLWLMPHEQQRCSAHLIVQEIWIRLFSVHSFPRTLTLFHWFLNSSNWYNTRTGLSLITLQPSFKSSLIEYKLFKATTERSSAWKNLIVIFRNNNIEIREIFAYRQCHRWSWNIFCRIQQMNNGPNFDDKPADFVLFFCFLIMITLRSTFYPTITHSLCWRKMKKIRFRRIRTNHMNAFRVRRYESM